MGKLYGGLATFAIATLLATGGFVGFLVGTGKVTALRMEILASVLRGELDEQALAAKNPPASQPASQPVGVRPNPEALRQRELREELLRAQAERALRDLDAQRALLNQALAHVVGEQERFVADKAAWQKQQDRLRQKNRDEGFELELKNVAKLDVALAKEHVLRTWQARPADAIRLLKGLGSRTPKILNEFKTPEEQQMMHAMLEQMRELDIDKLAPTSGRKPDAPQTVKKP